MFQHSDDDIGHLYNRIFFTIKGFFYSGVFHKWRHGFTGKGVNNFVTTVLRACNKKCDNGRGWV